MTEELFQQGRLLPVIEEFYTLQGEGFHTGKPAYFIRIGGCDIGCSWCDSKHSWVFGVHLLTPTDDLVERCRAYPSNAVVITGGEPSFYPLDYLTSKLKEAGMETFIETSGAYPLTGRWDWICLSPKRHSPPRPEYFPKAGELKVIVENPDDFLWAEQNAGLVAPECHLFLQPEWSKRATMTDCVIEYVKNHPRWRISLQTHKYIGIP
ncbi:MAG: 7-carboxy-7-deazaguanine synthase QueE [Bacteroidales bacterium]